MSNVFISYKAEEYEQAFWVKKSLENSGISCWLAPESLPGGSNYADQIPKAIRQASAFVLILSKASQSSKWVEREVDLAINEGKLILPFTIENQPLTDSFKFYLANVQRYAAYEDKEGALAEMIKEIKANLNGNGTALKNSERAMGQKNTAKKNKGWLLPLTLGCFAALMLLLFVAVPNLQWSLYLHSLPKVLFSALVFLPALGGILTSVFGLKKDKKVLFALGLGVIVLILGLVYFCSVLSII